MVGLEKRDYTDIIDSAITMTKYNTELFPLFTEEMRIGLELISGINTPLAFLGVQEAFVTCPTEERYATTFSPSSSINIFYS